MELKKSKIATKIVSFVLVFLMYFTMIPINNVYAADVGIGTDGSTVDLSLWGYTKSGNYYTLTSYKATINNGKIKGTVPATINGIPVTSMNNTFKSCTGLITVPVIPSTVTSLSYTFYGCTGITTAPTIPSGVTNLSYAFYGCTGLKAAPTIPGKVTSMSYTFYGCTKLTTAPTIPSSVTNMSYTFSGCTGIKTAPTIPSKVTNMSYTFNGCTGLTAAPTIPSSVTNMSYTFNGCKLLKTAPTIPDSVTNLSYTFSGCIGLKTAPAIPSSVTNLLYTFSGCTGLTSAPTIPSRISNLSGMFNGCTGLKTAPIIPNSVTNLSYTFNGCKGLTTAPIIPDSVTNMSYTFKGCTGLKTAPIIPNSVTNLTYTFSGCTGLTTAPTIPSSVTDLPNTFSSCTGLTIAPIIPSSVTNLSYTFSGCTKLTTVPIIPSSVTNLTYTFNGCTGLITAPIIPSSVTNMSYTFNRCTRLTTAPIIPSGVINMSYTFNGCTGLTTAPTIPSSVTDLPYAFSGCIGLTCAPIIPCSVTNLSYTFNGCTGLTTAPMIPSSVTNMANTFNNCINLTGDVYIPKSVNNISNAFTNTLKPINMIYSPTNTAVSAYSSTKPSNITMLPDSDLPVVLSVSKNTSSSIMINATDNYKVNKYAITTSPTVAESDWMFSNEFTGLTLGNTYYAWVMDGVGNISEYNQFTFNINTEIEIETPLNGQGFYYTFPIKFKVSGDGSIIKTSIKIGNQTYYTNNNMPLDKEVIYSLSPEEYSDLPNGNNIISITVTDENGGIITEKKIIFRKNTITTKVSGTYIDFSWPTVQYAHNYELELDGKIINMGLKTSYRYSGLSPSTQHTFRLRIIGLTGANPWCPIQTIFTTDGIITKAPQNISSNTTNNKMIITWDAVDDAEEYDINLIASDVVSGSAISFGNNTTCELVGLNPNTTYKFKIRAKNAAMDGPWSEELQNTTKQLDTPQIITVIKSDTSILFSWNKVEGATSYKFKINGVELITAITETSYLYTTTPNTEYTYSIKAVGSVGESSWRDEKRIFSLPTKPGIPNDVFATVSDHQITVNWTLVSDSTVRGYDLELDKIDNQEIVGDEIVLENGIDTVYTHSELEPYSLYSYRVRARNELVEGDWSEIKYIRTLPTKPVVPTDITIKSTQTGATLSWKPELGATGYDLYVFKLGEKDTEVKVEEITNIVECRYIHRKQAYGEEYRYRIRTRNVQGISDWSCDIINNAIKAECKKNNTIDLGLTATDVVDFSSYEMVVTYNPGVVEVVDLSTLTDKVELTIGKIEGTNVAIKGFSYGRILFVIDKAATPGEAWTGVINGIKFKAKETGGTTITYTVFTKPQK